MDFPRYIDNPHFFGGVSGKRDNCEGLRLPRPPSQNIVNRLCGREVWGGYRQPMTSTHLQRSMYQSILPNFTVTDIVKPTGAPVKFAPDGKDFIMTSTDGRSLEVYRFMGAEAANSLFLGKGAQWKEDHISLEDQDVETIKLRKSLFEKLFQLRFRILVAPEGEMLRNDCVLFTHDLRYMIAGSASPNQAQPVQHDNYWNNESLEVNPKYSLENYSIHLVDIQRGILSDSRHLKMDKIYLNQNHGISLFEDKLSILSVQHQTINILQIRDGKLEDVQRIGRFCHEDGELLYSQVTEFRGVVPKDEGFINDLKHRFLSHLFRRAYEDPDLFKLSIFRQYYDQLQKFRLLKAQILDQDHLLLKYTTEDFIARKCQGEGCQHGLFVFYNVPRTEVLAVYENTTEALVDLFQSLADHFMDNFLTPGGRFVSTPSNNLHSKELFRKLRQSLAKSKPSSPMDITGKILGGPAEATKRLLSPLPITAQSFNLSPYLDQGLFAYDDNRISPMGRGRFCGESPIRFYGRESKARKFQLHAGIMGEGSIPSRKGVVVSIFHPSAPFAISVERNGRGDWVTHVHLRIDPHSMMPL